MTLFQLIELVEDEYRGLTQTQREVDNGVEAAVDWLPEWETSFREAMEAAWPVFEPVLRAVAISQSLRDRPDFLVALQEATDGGWEPVVDVEDYLRQRGYID